MGLRESNNLLINVSFAEIIRFPQNVTCKNTIPTKFSLRVMEKDLRVVPFSTLVMAQMMMDARFWHLSNAPIRLHVCLDRIDSVALCDATSRVMLLYVIVNYIC